MMNKSYLLLTAMLASPSLWAASFDCREASTSIEKMICARQDTTQIDEELAAAYKQALNASTNKEKLKQEQLAWLKERNQCSSEDCLLNAYKKRLKVLIETVKYPLIEESGSEDGFKGEPEMQSVTIAQGRSNEVCRIFLNYIKTVYRKGDCYLRPYPKDKRWKVPELHKTDMKKYEEQEIVYATKDITDPAEILRLTNRYKAMNENGERAAGTLKFDYDNDGRLNETLYQASLKKGTDQCFSFGGGIVPLIDNKFDYSKLAESVSGFPFIFNGISYLGNDNTIKFLRDKNLEESGIYVNGSIYSQTVCNFAH